MSSLGNDIILGEILTRLPVKSVVRFKCVSKSYQTLISSQEFIQLYLRHNSYSSDDLLVVPEGDSIICYDLNSSTPTATFTFNPTSSLHIFGSCNGVLYSRYDTNNTLLNPTSRIFLDFVIPRGGLGSHRGFAFDPVSLDFKIVGFSDKYNEAAINTRITKVYNVNTNSWTILDTQFRTDSVETRHSNGVVINNYLVHWMFWSPALRKRRIGCFDVCKMEWVDDVLLPSYYYDPTHCNYLLEFGALDGRLCSTFENKVDSCFDVWVMMEYGVQDSWFKLFGIPFSEQLPNGVIPVASRSAVEVLLLQRSNRSKFCWYNRLDGQMSDTNFCAGLSAWSDLKPYMCSRSAVELPGGRLFDDR